MTEVWRALVPVAAVIAAGWVFKARGFPGPGFWAPAERLAYYVLLPALIVGNLAAAPLSGLDVTPMVAAMVAALAVGAGVMLALKRVLGVDGAAFSSLFQGAIRGNTYIGIAVSAALFGDLGVSLSAVAIATLVPLVNLASVAVLARHAGVADVRRLALAIAGNPLILACGLGFAVNAAGLGGLFGLVTTLEVLGRAALALGLLCVGAGLTFGGAVRSGLAVSAAIKLVLAPLVAFAVARALGAGAVETAVVAVWVALPTATSSYILARQMGGDARLMAQAVALTHLLGAVTLPALLALAL